jgi:hypothetical protein
MRRIACVLALAGLMIGPAPALAATPPAPDLAVSAVHFAGRGVVELDVTYRCVAAPRGAEWEAWIDVEVDQGRGRGMRSAYDGFALDGALCDGTVHIATLQLAPEYGRGFRGGRVTVWAYLEAGWYLERTDEWVDQGAYVEGLRFRVHRS